tara:strand:+ start:819 stop:1424 length:606 start_codon:yes stop_codon:yes gene_type:complete
VSNSTIPDIDLDVKDRNEALSDLTYVKASMFQNKELRRHPTGIFFQRIPTDPKTGLAAFPSGAKAGDLSEAMGYYKIDLIPNTAYVDVRDPDHLNQLIEMETDWSLLKNEEVVQSLQHINGHFDIIDAYGPDNIEDLACLIALIRPGKMHLIGEPWEIVRENVWKKDGDQYTFKKSHAVAFALMITVQLKSMLVAGRFGLL